MKCVYMYIKNICY